ncbi:uncharacterized protein LY89DRAFT_664797 [Mollisia scopiformis]|uniref:2EXR domain-containing protein n=1 Tax=Mollisia scopiformis TaxID=149040 RepID=A0A194XPF4_MOLSC|nr:uncharacterized protein LY89DRAFT_664797 [Mollisia scopiformis]KUJ21617.1 hypothetical protein LY89DRAFT_664797 [Mollisia scopiformis]
MAAEPSFPRFRELPLELRIQIWELTIVPRYIRIRIRETYGNAISGRAVNDSVVPNVLQVNRESRALFLPRYPMMFKGIYSIRLPLGSNGVRFNLDLDVIVLNTFEKSESVMSILESPKSLSSRLNTFTLSISKEDLISIRRVVLPAHFITFLRLVFTNNHHHHYHDYEIHRLQSLETILIPCGMTTTPEMITYINAFMLEPKRRCPNWQIPGLQFISETALDEVEHPLANDLEQSTRWQRVRSWFRR